MLWRKLGSAVAAYLEQGGKKNKDSTFSFWPQNRIDESPASQKSGKPGFTQKKRFFKSLNLSSTNEEPYVPYLVQQRIQVLTGEEWKPIPSTWQRMERRDDEEEAGRRGPGLMSLLSFTPGPGWEEWVETSAQVWGKDTHFLEVSGEEGLSHDPIDRGLLTYCHKHLPHLVLHPHGPCRSSCNHWGLVQLTAWPPLLIYPSHYNQRQTQDVHPITSPSTLSSLFLEFLASDLLFCSIQNALLNDPQRENIKWLSSSFCCFYLVWNWATLIIALNKLRDAVEWSEKQKSGKYIWYLNCPPRHPRALQQIHRAAIGSCSFWRKCSEWDICHTLFKTDVTRKWEW